MTVTALRYLNEAASAGSMRAAGDRMGIAVSSISRQIAQLELEYGLPLIERGRRVIQLTHAGTLVTEHYRSMLADREALLARLHDLRGVRSGHVILGVGEGFLGNAFTRMLDGFRRANPQIHLTVEVKSSADIVHSVLADEAHFGLVLQVPPDPKIRLRTSVAQPLMAIMAPTHPLAAAEQVMLSDLLEHDLCLAPKDFRIRQILAAAEFRHHVFLEPAMTTNSIHIMREVARSGTAISILPSLSVRTDLEDGTLVAIPIADAMIEETTLGLISRVGRQLEGAPLRLFTAVEADLRNWAKRPTTG